MKRRYFGQVIAGSAIGAGVASFRKSGIISANAAPEPKKKALMHVGSWHYDNPTVKDAQYLQRHGVKHLSGTVKKASSDGVWDLDDMNGMKDFFDKNDISLDALRLNSTSIVMRGKSPERDRSIDTIIENIKKAAEVGIPSIHYDMMILSISQNYLPPWRGGSSAKRWTLEENWENLPPTKAGKVPLEENWERLTYFLERVIPVAEEYKVKMAFHPDDPPTPPGYRGVTKWNTQIFEGMKRYVETVESPYNGFLFCLGTVSEGLEDPGKEVYEIVRYFGERKKIFLVHFRNIVGKRYDFVESYPDEGDVDMYQIMKVLRDVEYPYMIMPDHLPTHPDDPDRSQAFAFGYGYIKALIQAVNSEV